MSNWQGFVSTPKNIIGNISNSKMLIGKLSNSKTLVGLVAVGTVIHDSGIDVYEGPYTVTSSVTEQVLTTNRKIMQYDLTVEKIPYFEVTNNSGGVTATIGG